MGLYNFQQRFAAKVESGEKTHTIRARRKLPAKVGETLYLYTGLRQPGARKLIEAKCTKVEEVRIEQSPAWSWGNRAVVFVGGVLLSTDEKEQLAVRDGFADWADMEKFWDGRLPFLGDMIHWRFEPKAGK